MTLNIFEVYELLPKNNCKNCGKSSCMDFAQSLMNGEKNASACAPLREPHYADQRLALQSFFKKR